MSSFGIRLSISSLALWLSCATAFVSAAEQSWEHRLFPDFADGHTVVLWLFDEPGYYHITLTDAGINHYDLRLLEGGTMCPGKFGNALGPSGCGGPVSDYPYASGAYDDPYVSWGHDNIPDARPIAPPEELLKTLAGKSWTWEFWVKCDEQPSGRATIVQLGTAKDLAFQCDLSPRDRAFILHKGTAQIGCPTEIDKLTDGKWHHIAFTCEGPDSRIRHFLDGRRQAKTKPVPEQPAGSQWHSGLVGSIFEDFEFTQGRTVRAAANIHTLWGTPRDTAWAQRWHGWIKSPTHGKVDFAAECTDGFRLTVGEQVVIDSLNDRGKRYGTTDMKEEDWVPIRVEIFQKGKSWRAHLSWRWKGQDWHTMPAAALRHRDEDVHTAMKEVGSAIDHRFYMSLCHGRFLERPFRGWIDEMRVSDVVRYGDDFTLPGSFSRNYGTNPPRPQRPNGPPLLFEGSTCERPIHLGSRKHVFIDDILLETRHNLFIRANPPLEYDITDMQNGNPWENPGFSYYQDCCLYDHDGGVHFVYPNHGMWSGRQQAIMMAVSKDGIHFEKPVFGHERWEANRNNNIIVKDPVQGRVFKDTNPNAPASVRFKFTAFDMQRGIYLYLSPDGIHWRRNETIMLPFCCGGGVETFWDDQRGEYMCYPRSESWAVRRPPFGRSVSLSRTREIFKPLPFEPIPQPAITHKAWNLASLSTELPSIFEPYEKWNTDPGQFERVGHVYRSRVIKYEWAPDTYLAFPWRLFKRGNFKARQSELGVSRDGIHWRFFGKPFYFSSGWVLNGKRVVESLAVHGLVRRSDRIWQYSNVKFKTLNNTTKYDRLVRYIQRLDGFVSLETDLDDGFAQTHPFTFEGNRLELNVDSQGSVCVALLDEQGFAIPGYMIDDCDPIRTDSVRHVVTWNGNSDVSTLSGRVVRLHLEMDEAKLYAFQFVK